VLGVSLRFRDWAFLVGSASAGLLVYGALYETKRLVVERYTIGLPHWPASMAGFKIALLGDFHLRDRYSMELAKRAVAEALDAGPDMVVLIGDFVGYWKPESAAMIGELLEPMLLMNGNVVAVPGNHEYWAGDPSLLAPILDELNIRFLRNEHWKHQGINWIGIDSANVGRADPYGAFEKVGSGPRVVLWHEPDPVDVLPFDADIQLSGHSHGGQWKFPLWTPIHTRNGVKYEQGFYSRGGKTPLYVTRGVGTTGPPARFMCPPDVSILTLVPGDRVEVVEQCREPAG
jgi:predicted MPP superfamily phosphohydrolase